MAQHFAISSTTVKRFLSFLNSTGSPYHSVAAVQSMLEDKGFMRLNESEKWNLKSGGRYYIIKNFSMVMAFAVGSEFNPHTSGISLVASHTDSPCLKLKPNYSILAEKCVQLDVLCYGGGLWKTWLDRGLGLAGKVVIKDSEGLSLREKLIRVARPVCIIPNLAIHLQENISKHEEGFNKEVHLNPILCTQAMMNEAFSESKSDGDETSDSNFKPLLNLIAREANCKVDDIADLDISLMDATESRLCGIYEEFIESARIDNLTSVFASFSALIQHVEKSSTGSDICVSVAFDHEEVGSGSFVGAMAETLQSWLQKICGSLTSIDNFPMLMSRSFLISSDTAHATHPNYASKHEANHKIRIHEGIVVKYSPNAAYCTDLTGSVLAKELARLSGVKLQDFILRNDMRGGSTVGPLLATKLGLRGIDLGIPQLAMHSCRELCGTRDIVSLVKFLECFYGSFRQLDTGLSPL